MKTSKLNLIILGIATIIFNSCSYRMLDFTLVSTKNVDLSKASSFERGKQRVEGEDMVHIVIYVPIGRPNLKEAVDRAIESTPGCIALVDGVIYSKFWWVPLLYGQSSFLVEGTPLIDPTLASNIPKYGKISIDKQGKFKNIETISEEEYFAIKDGILKNSRIKRFNSSQEL